MSALGVIRMTGDLEKVTKTLEEISNPIVVTSKRLPRLVIALVAFFIVLLLVVLLSYGAVMNNAVHNLEKQIEDSNTQTVQQFNTQRQVIECVNNVQVQSQALFNDLLLSFRSTTPASPDEINEKLRVLTEANSRYPIQVAACQAGSAPG